MQRIASILFAIALTACGASSYHEAHDLADSGKVEALRAKYDTYLAQSVALRLPEDRFAMDCDWMLFAGLNSSVTGFPDNPLIPLARNADGEWQRTFARPCYPSREDEAQPATDAPPPPSKSTFSRDMMLGLFWWAWRAERLDVLEQIATYLTEHNGVFGRPFPEMASRVLISGNQLAILYQAIYVLSGGAHDAAARRVPTFVKAGVTDFEAHLQVLTIMLWGEIYEAANARGLGLIARPLALHVRQDMYDRLAEHATREPGNPLFAAALATYSGAYELAVDLLMDEVHWPADHLPTTANHCEFWVTQRDAVRDGVPNPNWAPCVAEGAEPVTHSGGDWLFAADLVLRRGLTKAALPVAPTEADAVPVGGEVE